MSRFIDPSGKLFGHMDRLAEIQQENRTRAPISMEVDLSNRCSLGCEWCHFAHTHTKGPLAGKREKPAGAIPGGDLMTPYLARRMIDQFVDAGVRSVTWTGGGEPTLHPDFDAIIEYAYSGQWDYPEGGRADVKRARIEQGIYTHGGHINEARASLLKRALTFAYVSLDAATQEAYSRDKGVGPKRFHAACDGIQRLVAASGACAVGVGFLLTETNWRDHAEMVVLAKRLGADYAQFRPTILYEQATPGEPAEDTAWMREALPELEAYADDEFVECDLGRFKRYIGWDGHGYETCYWSALQSVVTPNGKMWTCVNKREHPAEEIGDLSTEAFDDIWRRHKPAMVNERCRVLCRGDVANQTLDKVMRPAAHAAFV